MEDISYLISYLFIGTLHVNTDPFQKALDSLLSQGWVGSAPELTTTTLKERYINFRSESKQPFRNGVKKTGFVRRGTDRFEGLFKICLVKVAQDRRCRIRVKEFV